LKAQRAEAADGDEDATTLNIAAHRLENLGSRRRQMLANRQADVPGA
jgi:hypothetical protein